MINDNKLNIQPNFFASQSEFRKWLKENHDKEKEILVGFYKVNSGKLNMTWSQSVDQALCYGWIDGIRRSIDKDSYCIRFTPRNPKSIWSAINIKKVEELTKQGLMTPAGLVLFNSRKAEKSELYSYERKNPKLSSDFEKIFKDNKKAWKFFQSLAPSYQKPSINWVMSAKQETTRLKRLNELITDSEAGRKIKGLK